MLFFLETFIVKACFLVKCDLDGVRVRMSLLECILLYHHYIVCGEAYILEHYLEI